ncbi:MAG: glycosyltransferase [Bacteroidales bacterium]|nr:glycosyltransferase [Bacteroidales bacterium]
MASISIIIPFYNVELYLERCLKSIIDQTFTDWKAILVNDGSTDSSLAIAEEFASRDRRFIIINKENRGLSDARNIGMANADSEYVMFVDSDDFIHPQTCEIALALARKTQSDIVSWKRDPQYRTIIKKIRKIFRTPETKLAGIMPYRYNKRYKIDKIKYTYTENILKYVTEDLGSHESPRIKGAYVWRHCFKKELIDGIKFIKGIKYEDFPWWNEVLLKNPNATITTLPLYFYYPNRQSIVNTTNKTEWFKHWSYGLEVSYLQFKEQATQQQMFLWSKNIKWNAIIGIVHNLKILKNENSRLTAEILGRMDKTGIFNDAKEHRHEKYAAHIRKFIKLYAVE